MEIEVIDKGFNVFGLSVKIPKDDLSTVEKLESILKPYDGKSSKPKLGNVKNGNSQSGQQRKWTSLRWA